jgi:hypothetical protein
VDVLQNIWWYLKQGLVLCSLVVLVLMLVYVPAAQADPGVTPPPNLEAEAANKSASANDIASEKVSQFVQAYLQVLSLVEQKEPIVQAAETRLEASQLEREIEAEAWVLVEKTGLTRQEYLQLLGLANSDTEFGERIAAQLQEAD